MPETTKVAMIKELSEQVKKQKILLKSFRKRLLTTLKENINLKSQLAIDCELAELEYNDLLRGKDKSSGSDNVSQNESENIECDKSSTKNNNDRNSEDDDDDCESSSHYPDKHPVSVDSFSSHPGVDGSRV